MVVRSLVQGLVLLLVQVMNQLSVAGACDCLIPGADGSSIVGAGVGSIVGPGDESIVFVSD